MKILMLDNYDSFTYNLVNLVQECGEAIDVYRNDEISLDEVDAYDTVILSPGPGLPKDAGIMCSLISKYHTHKKIFGVCLGMQAIAEVFGGSLINLPHPVHGQGMPVTHKGSPLFKNIPQTFTAGRYHSWAVGTNSLPDVLEVTATDNDGIIMALQHKIYNVSGVQFHPESVLTEYGKALMDNFLHR